MFLNKSGAPTKRFAFASCGLVTFTKFASDIVVKKGYYPLQLKFELFALKFNKILSDADFADVADEQLWGRVEGRAGLSSRLY